MRVAIYHLNQLGDLLFSLPFLAAIKVANPDSVITSILTAGLKPLASHIPYIDSVITRPSGNRIGWWREIEKNRFDWFISLSSSPSAYLTAKNSEAPRRTGFQRIFFDKMLTEAVEHKGAFSIHASVKLRDHIGLPSAGDDYRGMVRFNHAWADSECKRWGYLDISKAIVVAPGSSVRRGSKRWPIENIIKLIQHLASKNHTILLTGAENERSTLQRIQLDTGNAAMNLAGALSLPQLSYLLSKAKLVICNDSGPLHLASVFETPTIALFGPTCPSETGPYNKNAWVIKASDMRKISFTRVIDAAERILN